MIKRIFLCACLCAGCLSANAKDKQLNVKLLDGNIVSVKFDESSAIRFSDGLINIEADPKTDLQISEVVKLYFSDLTITDAPVEKADYVVTLNRADGTIVLSGAQGKTFSLLSVNGVVVTNAQVVDSDWFTINVPATKGVYILKVENQSYKIIKN